eukprot:TRINITY_DN2332_c0_g1_i2.p2 TRINITY_DN2332_c0_g1~~TRINITY_DN2332_c0_g1_i2.p2  ORF type:complete len:271 (+),score=68.08 TRINITY_DN2332_c0_g1_i2:339-1151(+)
MQALGSCETCQLSPQQPIEWKEMPAMLEKRCDFTASYLPERNAILVVGGNQDFQAATALCEVFDLQTNQWAATAPLPSPRSCHAAAVLGGKVFVFGGTRNFFSCIVYDPETNKWEELPPMPHRRVCPAACAVGSLIYVFGSDLVDVDVYDPAANKWSTAAPTLKGRYAPGACVLGGRYVMLCGGFRFDLRSACDCELYDTQTQESTVIRRVPSHIIENVAAVTVHTIPPARTAASPWRPAQSRGAAYPQQLAQSASPAPPSPALPLVAAV